MVCPSCKDAIKISPDPSTSDQPRIEPTAGDSGVLGILVSGSLFVGVKVGAEVGWPDGVMDGMVLKVALDGNVDGRSVAF